VEIYDNRRRTPASAFEAVPDQRQYKSAAKAKRLTTVRRRRQQAALNPNATMRIKLCSSQSVMEKARQYIPGNADHNAADSNLATDFNLAQAAGKTRSSLDNRRVRLPRQAPSTSSIARAAHPVLGGKW